MSAVHKERRGRKVYMGPFDTFVKQLQNIATLFPGMSDAEQHQAVNILKKFTSVIAERFGSDDPLADIEDNNDIKPVEIIPLSPDVGEDIVDDTAIGDSVHCGTRLVSHETKSDANNQVKQVIGGDVNNSDISSQYYNLTVTNGNGCERVILLKKEDVTTDEDGTVIINKAEVRAFLDELITGDSTYSPGLVLSNKDICDNQALRCDDGRLASSNLCCSAVSGDGNDTINVEEHCKGTKEVINDTVQASSGCATQESVEPVSKPAVLTESSPQSESAVLENISESHSISPGSNEIVVIRRKRGRPKGSKKGQSSREKTVCSVCGKQLNNKSNLTVHMRSHTGERPYKCQYCDDAFTTRGNLRRHKAAHLGEKKFVCHVCQRAFLEKKSMIMHMRRHTGEKPYSCESCGQRFRQSSALRIHRAKHTGIRNHICCLCNKSFVQKGALILHMKQHSEGKTVSCPDCSRLFYNKEQMAKHRQRHGKGVIFRCVLCSVSLTSQNGLIRHMTTFHGEGGERKFVCKPCNEEYQNKHELQDHVKSLMHLQVVRSMEDGESVSELLQAGVHLEELSKGELQDLPLVKQEVLLGVEEKRTDSEVYHVNNKESTISSQESRPSQTVITSLADVIISDKANEMYVLKNMPQKITEN